MSERLVVNAHYLDRLVALAETAGVEATEDIVTGNGVKLLAKGGRIDVHVRDRLLQHKLRKPLESSTRVVGSVSSRPIDMVAQGLLAKHALLAGVCDANCLGEVAQALRSLTLSTPVDSMLSVYAAQGPLKLEHAVGVALLAAALQHNLDRSQALETLIVAGLMHDVGELYIDPAILNSKTRLSPTQWKHIASHPIVAATLLRELEGAGADVAATVLHHHERLDGFGYPQGISGSRVPLNGQILAMAEMLMGLVESGRSPGERAAIAVKLIPGEFNRQLLSKVSVAGRASVFADAAESITVMPVEDEVVAKAAQLGGFLMTLQRLLAAARSQVQAGSKELQQLYMQVVGRSEQLLQAFVSTGLDTTGVQNKAALTTPLDLGELSEISIVLQEIEWRLRELRRESRHRAERLCASETALVELLITQCRASLPDVAKRAESVMAP